MLGLKLRGLIRAFAVCGLAAATLAAKPALAELRQTTAPTVSGATFRAVVDTTSGLEWLSPQATNGLSYVEVAQAGYFGLGYRFATSADLLGLLQSAGITSTGVIFSPVGGGTQEAADSLRGLIRALGDTTGRTEPLASNADSNLIIFGFLEDTAPLGLYSPDQGHTVATLRADYPFYIVNVPGQAQTAGQLGVGSFLVRQVSAVPEAGTQVLMVAGLLLLGGAARGRKVRRQ